MRGAIERLRSGTNSIHLRAHNMPRCASMGYADSFACEAEERASHAEEMMRAKYCLVPRGDTSSSGRLYDAISCLCVPVIISDGIELAFSDSIDWGSFSIRCSEEEFTKDPEQAVLRAINSHHGGYEQLAHELAQVRSEFGFRAQESRVVTNILMAARRGCSGRGQEARTR